MLFRILEEEIYCLPIESLGGENSLRRRAIEKSAYLLAEKRGFAPGHAVEDWLIAERHRTAWERGCARDTYWLEP